jgi:hypothetical protein
MERFSNWHDYKISQYTGLSKAGPANDSWVARGKDAMHFGLLQEWIKRKNALPEKIRSPNDVV